MLKMGYFYFKLNKLSNKIAYFRLEFGLLKITIIIIIKSNNFLFKKVNINKYLY